MGPGDKGEMREGNKKWLGDVIAWVTKKIMRSLRRKGKQEERVGMKRQWVWVAEFLARQSPGDV